MRVSAAAPADVAIREELYGVIPIDTRKPYDVREIIARIVDGVGVRRVQGALRHHAGHAASRTSKACRWASSPTTASCSPRAAKKGAHFIELCCQRKVPLVFLQNITGFMVGRKYENEGIARARRQDGDGGGHAPRCPSSRSSSAAASAPATTACAAAPSAALPVDVAERAHQRDGRRAGGERAGHRPARRHRGQGRRLERRRRRSLQGADPRAVRAPGPSVLRQRRGCGTTA